MGTPKSRKMRTRVCDTCGKADTVRLDNRSERCRSCATKKQHKRGELGWSEFGKWAQENQKGKPRKYHGKSHTILYATWLQMHQRCKNPKNSDYPNYGGRGITVCERWDDFEKFFKDMGPRPKGWQMHRINNDKGYEPDNVVYMKPSDHRKAHDEQNNTN